MDGKSNTKSLNELGESTVDDIKYGELCYLRQGPPTNIRLISRNYQVIYCECCKEQIKVKKEKSTNVGRDVFPSEKRFAKLRSCNKPLCRKQLSYRKPKIKEQPGIGSEKISSNTGQPVNKKVRKVHYYISSCR